MNKIQDLASAKLAHNIDLEEYAAVKAWIDRFDFNANHHELGDVALQVRYMMSRCIDEMTHVHSFTAHYAFPKLARPENYLENDALSLSQVASRMSDLAQVLEGLSAVLAELSSMPVVSESGDLTPA